MGTEYAVVINSRDVDEYVGVCDRAGRFSWHAQFRGDRLDAHDRATPPDDVVQVSLHEDVTPESLAASGVTLIAVAATQLSPAELAKVAADLRQRVPGLAALPW